MTTQMDQISREIENNFSVQMYTRFICASRKYPGSRIDDRLTTGDAPEMLLQIHVSQMYFNFTD